MTALDALHHTAWDFIASSPRRLGIFVFAAGVAPFIVEGMLL